MLPVFFAPVLAENLIRLHNRCQNLSFRSVALGSFKGRGFRPGQPVACV
jgi:hypothetical protein